MDLLFNRFSITSYLGGYLEDAAIKPMLDVENLKKNIPKLFFS